jgi:hypothetical protein
MCKILKHGSNMIAIMFWTYMCTKRPQEIQFFFDYLYNFKSHIPMQKQDFHFKRVQNFKQAKQLQQLNFHVHNQGDNCCQSVWQQLVTFGLIQHTCWNNKIQGICDYFSNSRHLGFKNPML